MTERSETERAELVALADWIKRSDYLVTPGIDQLKKIVAALRRLAGQDQKPVAWLQSSGTKTIVSQQRLDMDASRYGWTEKPLYLSPPPAAGWDAAIEACKKVAEKWLESFMGGEVYVARSIVNAIEALRRTAPPDSGAGKSAPPGEGSLPSGESVGSVMPDHGGADAGVKAQIATLAQRFWTIHPRELQDKGMTREDFYIREMTALVAALSKPAPVDANASAEARLREALDDIRSHHDAWRHLLECQRDHSARCRELDDASYIQHEIDVLDRVVAALSHQPAPVAANTSAEARLREALEKIAGSHFERIGHCQTDVEDVPDMTAEEAMLEARKALSTHPHASDCDKQEENNERL